MTLASTFGTVPELRVATRNIWAVWWYPQFDHAADAQTLLNRLDDVRCRSLTDLELRDPPNPRRGSFFNVYIHHGAADPFPDDWGMGVGTDRAGNPFMTVPSDYVSWRNGIDHEGFHVFQYSSDSPGFAYQGDSQWYTEAAAQWYSVTRDPTGLEGFLTLGAIDGNPHLALWHSFSNEAPGDPRNWTYQTRQYAMHAFLFYLTDVAQVERSVVTDGFYGGVQQRPQEYLFRRTGANLYRRVFADWAAHNTADFDYLAPAIVARARREFDRYGDPNTSHPRVASFADTGTNGSARRPPSALEPRPWSYNVIEVTNTAAASYTFRLRGDVSGSAGAAAHFAGRVVVIGQGGPVYTEFEMENEFDGAATVVVNASDTRIYLVVAAMPEHFRGNQTFGYEYEIARVSAAPPICDVTGQPFSTSAVCATVAPAAWSAPPGRSTQSVTVSSTVTNLAWTAFTDRPWLTVSRTSGVGAGTVTLTAAATRSVRVRTATAWIAGQPVAVTQAAGTPSFSVTPQVWHAPDAGGTQTVTVASALTDAPWTASTSEAWLTVSTAGGVGSSTVTLTAEVSPGGGFRTATATIAGRTVSVSQGSPRPVDVRVTRVEGNLVTLRWSWPGPPTSGFVVAVGVQPGQTLARLPTGSDSPIYTFIAPTGSFFVRVHAAEDTAFGRPSNEVPLIVNVPVAPSAPANLLGTISGNRVDLAWTDTFGGGAPAGVTLQVGGAVTTAFPLGLTDRFSFVGVPPGTYTLAVVATNAGGVSQPSNAVTLTFPTGCTGAPLTPTQFLAYRIGRTVFVVWEPAETGPAPIDYALNVAELGLSLPTGGERTLSGTVSPGRYTVAVSASNLCGASAPTAAQTVVVP